jgi:hypothetical protein
MKRVIFCAFLLLFVTYGIASAGMFGPTEPVAQPGKFSLGVGYFCAIFQVNSPTAFSG